MRMRKGSPNLLSPLRLNFAEGIVHVLSPEWIFGGYNARKRFNEIGTT